MNGKARERTKLEHKNKRQLKKCVDDDDSSRWKPTGNRVESCGRRERKGAKNINDKKNGMLTEVTV